MISTMPLEEGLRPRYRDYGKTDFGISRKGQFTHTPENFARFRKFCGNKHKLKNFEILDEIFPMTYS